MRGCLLAVIAIAMPTSALADEHENLATLGGEPQGTLLVSSTFRINSDRTTWFWSTGRVSQRSDRSEPGLELRASYSVIPRFVLELELGRPDADDRLGHAEDFHRDRARLLARYELGRTGDSLGFTAQFASGVTAVTDDVMSFSPTVGFGGSAEVALGNRRGRILAFATGGRPGTTGTHGSLGASLKQGTRWFQSVTYWRGYTWKRGTVEGHQLWGLQGSVGRLVGRRWTAFATFGMMQWPRSFVLRDDVNGRVEMWMFSFGAQRRFGSTHKDAATRDDVYDDPWDAYRDGAEL